MSSDARSGEMKTLFSWIDATAQASPTPSGISNSLLSLLLLVHGVWGPDDEVCGPTRSGLGTLLITFFNSPTFRILSSGTAYHDFLSHLSLLKQSLMMSLCFTKD